MRFGIRDEGPHAQKDIDDAGAGGVEADVFERDLRSGRGGGGDHPERGAGDVPRHDDVRGSWFLAAIDADAVILAQPFDAKVSEQTLGVVPSGDRLHDGGLARREQTSQQDGAFHLGAGDGELVINRLQRTAFDGERRADFFALAGDLRTHQAQGIGHALHRTAGERGIAKQLGFEVLPGEDAGEQADGGAGVAAIDGLGRRFELQAVAGDGEFHQADAFHFFQRLHGCSKRLHGMHGAEAVLAGQEALDDGGALRESGEHRGAVGDAFVTRNGDFGGDAFEFLRLEAGHESITSSSKRPARQW
jgi:hypothetical protein